MIVNVSEAKTNLSKLIEMAYHGEEVIIAQAATFRLALMSDDSKILQYDCKII